MTLDMLARPGWVVVEAGDSACEHRRIDRWDDATPNGEREAWCRVCGRRLHRESQVRKPVSATIGSELGSDPV